MTKIVVDPQQLQSAAQKVDGYRQTYSGNVQKLYGSIDAMTSAWQGEDNLAYTTQIKQFQKEFQKMDQMLQQYSDFLRNAANQYSQTQTQVTNGARGLAT